ncbi:MAG TPA: hypothetical protein VMW94_09265 [Actinomycetes bacterium]|nr:hypothetical protein [Actinomycetes bacterium]
MYDHLRCLDPQPTFGRQPIQQTWAALAWIERIITSKGINCCLELGTGSGVLSTFLALHFEPGRVVTCDHVDRRSRQTVRLHDALGVQFVVADLYKQGTPDWLAGLLSLDSLDRMLIFCDGGDKVSDLDEYAGQLRPGDLALVHDRGTEFHPEEETVARIAALHDLTLHAIDAALASDGTYLACYVKRG